MIVHACYHFIGDHRCYFFAHHLTKLLLAFALACRELIPHIICLFQHFNKLGISSFVRTWVNQLVTSQPCALPFESLG